MNQHYFRKVIVCPSPTSATARLLLQGLLALVVFATSHSPAQQSTAFTYQGQLRDGGTNANGAYTMVFKLFNAVTNGNQVGTAITNTPTLVNGLFSLQLDFGSGAFNGTARWLDITVAGETLIPRERILAVPYALYALNGVAGPQGPIGLTGPAGSQGPTGLTGATGPQGPPGAKGDTGATGAAGPQGLQGVKGDTGATGPQGIQGTPGPSGPPGINGVNSLNGLTNAIVMSAGTNVTLATNGNTLQISAAVTGLQLPPWLISTGNVTVDGTTFSGALRFTSSGTLRMGLDKDGEGLVVFGHLMSNGMTVNNDLVVHGPINADGDVRAGGDVRATGDVYARGVKLTSDRNAKRDFTAVNSVEILERVASLPISSWSFKQEQNTRHIGPMAQDFHAAFDLGEDEKHISAVDADGVALAAIQGLNKKLMEKEDRINALERRLAELEKFIGTASRK